MPSVMDTVSTYIATGLDQPLPDEVTEKTKHHILDTIGAIVSGSEMLAGQMGRRYAEAVGGTPEATVIGSSLVVAAANAAMANAFAAHADETDDSHAPSLTHPGCAIIPAALAMAERQGSSGTALIRAVALGYDIGTRIPMAAGPLLMDRRMHSSHTVGPMFGSAAAAGALVGITPKQARYLLSYTAQQASGVTTWPRDTEHVEKAFNFGGNGARNGITSAIFVSLGFTGVDDVFTGDQNFWGAFSDDPKPEVLVQGLGTRYEILATNIKKWSVGSPIQAPVEALTILMGEHDITRDNVVEVEVRLDARGVRIVNSREMPDVNLQYIMAVTVLDGGLTFAAAHDYPRMSAPDVRAMRERVKLVVEPALEGVQPPRQAIVTVTTADGGSYRHHMEAVPGIPSKPMTRQEIEGKCLDLMAPVLGADRARTLIERIWHLEDVTDVRELRPLLTVD